MLWLYNAEKNRFLEVTNGIQQQGWKRKRTPERSWCSILVVNQASSKQAVGVADANTGVFQTVVLVTLISDSKKRSFASERPAASKTHRIRSRSYLYTGGVALKEQTGKRLKVSAILGSIQPPCAEHKQPVEIPKVSQACEPRLAATYIKVGGSTTSKSGWKQSAQLWSMTADIFGHEFNRT